MDREMDEEERERRRKEGSRKKGGERPLFCVDVQPVFSVHAKYSGPLFSWQENRNLEKQPDCICWNLDNLAS